MRTLLLLLTLALGSVLAGCTGVAASPRERWVRYNRITDIQLRQAVDDWDYLWLYERPSQLTYWYVRMAD